MRTGLPLPHIIFNGGFPINFDRQTEWERETEISLTRALVLLGILQALCVRKFSDTNRIEKLAIKAQRKLVCKWLDMNQRSCLDYGVSEAEFDSINWWLSASSGQEYLRREFLS
jgi:hypothetical protein